MRERIVQRMSANGAAPYAGAERETLAPAAGASRAAL